MTKDLEEVRYSQCLAVGWIQSCWLLKFQNLKELKHKHFALKARKLILENVDRVTACEAVR